jgi:hypothetical protein
MKSRSAPHSLTLGGLCCSHDCRMATPPPATAVASTSNPYSRRPQPCGTVKSADEADQAGKHEGVALHDAHRTGFQALGLL